MANRTNQAPPPPPRLSGDAAKDVVAVHTWAMDFYKIGVVAGFFLDSASQAQAGTVTPTALPDPATATVATAQQTANDAYIAAQAAQATADKALAATVSGEGVIADAATSFTHTFAKAQADVNYRVVASPSGFAGAPAAGSREIATVAKTTADFTLTIAVAPGAGASVTFDFEVHRNA